MKNRIFSNWNFMRALKLVIGIAVIIQSFLIRDIMFAIAGFLLAVMTVFDIGCCGTGGCNTTKKVIKK